MFFYLLIRKNYWDSLLGVSNAREIVGHRRGEFDECQTGLLVDEVEVDFGALGEVVVERDALDGPAAGQEMLGELDRVDR